MPFNLLTCLLCKERDGWYSSHAFEQIKTILRHKFFSLLEGHVATEEECATLLSSNQSSSKLATTRNPKLRAGKHNLAKGALRPEDAAASGPHPSPCILIHPSLGRKTASDT